MRRIAARGVLINGAFDVALTSLGLVRGFVVAAFLSTTEYGTCPAESRGSAGPYGSPDRSGPTTCPYVSGVWPTSPSSPRAYGSTSSLAGLYRWPAAGSHGPWARKP